MRGEFLFPLLNSNRKGPGANNGAKLGNVDRAAFNMGQSADGHRPPWRAYLITTVLLVFIMHRCEVSQAVSSHRNQNARLRLELYEVTKARDALLEKLERYSPDVLKQERDSLAGAMAAMREDNNRRNEWEEDILEDLVIATEDKIALELVVQELRYRDSILTLYNAQWLVEYSQLEDSIRQYHQRLGPESGGFQANTYRQSAGGVMAFLLLLHCLFRHRQHNR